jgi:2-polyprenyl-3-methyl-5-hydroxy-6-metoxy-1,4-benzoquinol methylase
MGEKNHCLICGGSQFNTLFTCVDSLVSGEHFVISICEDCGFTFTASPPDEKEIGRYYLSEEYISHSDLKRSLTDQLYHLARSYMLRKKWRHINKATGLRNGNILDIGSGTGYFPAYMQQKGWTTTGIEISELAREYSISKFGLKVITPGQVETLNGNSFDCITLWHVMEHFQEPTYWLEKIRFLLKDDGLCLVAVPNAVSTDAKWFNESWAAYDVPRHLSHFSPATLSELITKSGFSIIEIRGMPLDVFYISILSYRNKKTPLPFIRGLITGLMITVRNIFKKNSASSLIYVFKKQMISTYPPNLIAITNS